MGANTNQISEQLAIQEDMVKEVKYIRENEKIKNGKANRNHYQDLVQE